MRKIKDPQLDDLKDEMERFDQLTEQLTQIDEDIRVTQQRLAGLRSSRNVLRSEWRQAQQDMKQKAKDVGDRPDDPEP